MGGELCSHTSSSSIRVCVCVVVALNDGGGVWTPLSDLNRTLCRQTVLLLSFLLPLLLSPPLSLRSALDVLVTKWKQKC